ncbi:PA14 domain-containing protein, partial [Georgenia sp. 10Sc9-8]|nr:PA14 domain-containing protein [Georgenia halotolerans]
SGGPDGLGKTNRFSATFSTAMNEGAGTYEFTARADDGVRVYVDDELVIDEWHGSGGQDLYTGDKTLTDGSHNVVVEYFENYGGAQIDV